MAWVAALLFGFALLTPTDAAAQADRLEFELLTPRPAVGEVALVRLTGLLSSPGPFVLTRTSSRNFLVYQEGVCILGICPPSPVDRIVTLGPFDEAGEHVVSYASSLLVDPPIDLVFDVAGSTDDPSAPWRVEPVLIDGEAAINDQDPVRLLFTRATPCEGARLLEARPIRGPADTALVARVLTWPAPCAEVDALETSAPGTIVEADFGVIPSRGGDAEVPVELQVITSAAFADAQATGTEPSATVFRLGTVTVVDVPDIAQLLGGRFGITSTWRDFDGETGTGRLVTGATDRSALFTFFGVENWELTVKMLDGCAVNDHYWVFLSAATDVEFVVRVEDRVTGAVREYANPLGTASPAVTDTMAFPCS